MDWEQHYLEKNLPWDKGAAAPPLLEWLANNEGALAGKRVFVPGCGLGHDVRSLAEAGADAVGFDVSETAVAEADAFSKIGSEIYREGNLFDLDSDLRGAFDVVFEHTCFCAIDPDRRDDYVEAVAAALRENGELLGVFYLNPYDNEHPRGGGPPHGTSAAELRDRFEARGPFQILEEYVPGAAYPGREGLELVLRIRKLT